MRDLMCLADGLVFPVEQEQKHINLNVVGVGPTRCGKTYSLVYPRLLHTYDSSLVVPLGKRAVKDKFEKMFLERGYEVMTLDFADPSKSEIGFDPMDNIHKDEDVLNLAKKIVADMKSHDDMYWYNAAASVIAALIYLEVYNAKSDNRKPKFANVLTLYKNLVYKTDDKFSSNYDNLFEEVDKLYPGNPATSSWKTIKGLASKTASCIISMVVSAFENIFSDGVMKMVSMKKKVDFAQIGEKRTVLFVITSPFNKSLQRLTDMLYEELFRTLFESAEKNEDFRLKVPVHVICDDFACTKINEFEDYISIFGAAGISVTLLLQSETQLHAMYGGKGAVTILNNCDTYVYMGGMDMNTCYNISQKANKPIQKVTALPLEQVIVIKRGMAPVQARRYQTCKDSLYKEVFETKEIEQEMSV